MRDQLDPFLPTRQSLLSRLKTWDDHESWRDFFDTYWRLIYGLAVKSGLTTTEAEDVVQETLLAVAKETPDFKYDPARGSFKGWLLEITRRRIANQVRRRLKHRHATAGPLVGEATRQPSGERSEPDQRRTATVERVPDPNSDEMEKLWDQEWAKKFAGGFNRSRQEAGQREAIPNVQPVRHAAMADGPGKENARCERRAGLHGQNADQPIAQKRSQNAGEENELVVLPTTRTRTPRERS